MESRVDSEVEPDGAEPSRTSAEIFQLQQHQRVKRVIGDDGSELVLVSAAEYNEMVRRQQVTDRLYDQLDDERRQRLEMSEKCRTCSEALARENALVIRYRQMLISNRLQSKPIDDASDTTLIGTELPELLFKTDRTRDDGEEVELRSHCVADESNVSSTESVQTTEKVAPLKLEVALSSFSRAHRSTLESDEAVIVAQPGFTDTIHDQWKNPTGIEKVAAAAEESPSQQETTSVHYEHLLDEVRDATTTVPMATSSTMSRDLLQKVLDQNARLKQLLRKIVDTQSMTIQEFLVSVGSFYIYKALCVYVCVYVCMHICICMLAYNSGTGRAIASKFSG